MDSKAEKELSSPMIRCWREILLALLLAVAALAAFSPVLRADFVAWDDNINIYENPHIRSLDGAHVNWMLTNGSYIRRYQPLVWLNYAWLYRFWGLNPFGFHLETLLFHAFDTVLLFWLIRRLLRLSFKSANDGPLLWCSGVAALLWGIHPLRAETVGWVSGGTYAPALMFTLLSLFFYLKAVAGNAERPACKNISYWLAVLMFAVSLLIYPIAIAFVAVLVVSDVFLLNRLPLSWSRWQNEAAIRLVLLEKLPFIAVSLAVAIVTKHAVNTGQYSPWQTAYGFHVAVSQAFYIWAYYLWKPWVPIHLSPIYTTLIGFDPATWYFPVSALGVLALGWVCFQWRRRTPLLPALWLCHIALLVPMLGLTENPHYPSDRYDYCVGLLWPVLIAFGLYKYWGHVRTRKIILILFLLALPVLGAMSFRQAQIWHNSETLFKAGIERLGNDPYRINLYSRLAAYYEHTGQTNLARQQYETILTISPANLEARRKLAQISP